jgi:hypothetical protein
MQTPKFLQIFTDKKQREHFWYYYKGHVIAAAFILVLLTMTIVDMVNNNRPVFQVTYVNVPSTLEASWTQHFTDTLPSDLERELLAESLIASDKVGITELEATVGRVCARIAAGEIDIFICDLDTFQQFAVGELFDDLQPLLPEDLISNSPDLLYYSNVDGKSCITGLLWKHPTNGTTYVFAIPYSSALKQQASAMIQSLFQKGDAQ